MQQKKLSENIDRTSWQPIRLRPKDLARQILDYKKNKKALLNDQYSAMLEELFLLKNPPYRFNKDYTGHYNEFLNAHLKNRDIQDTGNWFYFPWLNQLIHFLPEEVHLELRTGRNRFLITAEEQHKYYNATAVLMGMSVGSHVALTMAMTGGSKHMRLADPDTLSGSNLNRVRTGFNNIGTGKAIAVARQIYEINPYADIEIFQDGVTEENFEKVLNGANIIVEEMDNPYFKIKTRFYAREHKIPVIMAADNGDGIIVDVERFDSQKNMPILHGILGKMTPEQLRQVAPQDLPRTIAKMAGADIANLRMLDSVLQVGKAIYSWPQLGTAANLCGSTLAYLARRILVGDKIRSGRYEVNFDSIFEPGFNEPKQKNARDKQRKKYLKIMGL